MSRRRSLTGLLLVASVGLGCAGAGVDVTAKGDLAGPIGLTGTVFDSEGRSLEIGEGLEKIGDFEVSKRFRAILIFIAFDGREWDITEIANAALDESGGDAIVNIVARVEGAPHLAIATVLPIIPSYIDVSLRGDIVRAASIPPSTPEKRTESDLPRTSDSSASESQPDLGDMEQLEP